MERYLNVASSMRETFLYFIWADLTEGGRLEQEMNLEWPNNKMLCSNLWNLPKVNLLMLILV